MHEVSTPSHHGLIPGTYGLNIRLLHTAPPPTAVQVYRDSSVNDGTRYTRQYAYLRNPCLPCCFLDVLLYFGSCIVHLVSKINTGLQQLQPLVISKRFFTLPKMFSLGAEPHLKKSDFRTFFYLRVAVLFTPIDPPVF